MQSYGEVNPNFRRFSDTITVQELVSIINVSSFEYLVIERADSNYAVWPLLGNRAIQIAIDRAADKLGPRILELRLREVPKLVDPCLPVELNDPWSWKDRWTRQRQSPAQCTAVLEDGHLVGVFDVVSRGEYLTHLPGRRFALFQPIESEEHSHSPRYCSRCGKSFDFYEVEVIENQVTFACPHCRQAAEAQE
jgi:predicted RNA-binding Zn-ribbon protein involved in translation (DUF1610 family)